MGKLAIVISCAAVIACGKSGSGGDAEQRALCEKLVEKSGGCCGMTLEEKKIGIDACVAEKLDDAKRATIQCALDTPCDELMTGNACGGFRCKTKAANADLCRKLIAKADECCEFTPEDEAVGLRECEKGDISDQRGLVDCVLATSCTDLLAGGSCGGFKCKNK